MYESYEFWIFQTFIEMCHLKKNSIGNGIGATLISISPSTGRQQMLLLISDLLINLSNERPVTAKVKVAEEICTYIREEDASFSLLLFFFQNYGKSSTLKKRKFIFFFF